MFSRLFSRRDNDLEWNLTPVRYSAGKTEHHSGKIFLPHMCLVTLVSKQVETPYIFKISAHGGISYTHVGVQEFIDGSDEVFIPNWLHDQLGIDNTQVEVTCVSLPKGQFIRLLPQSKDFLDIENPKESLEDSLRNYQVLTEGDTISLYIQSEFKHLLFTVAEIKPKGEGISIIDTDLEVDFLPPVDYIENKLEKGEELITVGEDGAIFLSDPFFTGKEDSLGVVFS